jgi:hypothetical protein
MLKLRHAQSSWRASFAIAATAALFVVGAAQAQQSPPPFGIHPGTVLPSRTVTHKVTSLQALRNTGSGLPRDARRVDV